MKNILLCTDGSNFSQIGYGYAAWIAKRMDASIEVLYVTDMRKKTSTQVENFSGSIGVSTYHRLLEQLVELESEAAKVNNQRAKIILEEAKRFLIENGVSQVNSTHRKGFLVDCFQEFEAKVDLIVLGKRGETAGFAAEHLGANLERIIRTSHKPCLVTPKDYHPIKRILFAYDGGKSCDKALDFLVDSPTFKDLELHIITIAKNHDTDTAQNYLNAAELKAIKGGFKPICHMLDGEPEKLMSECIDRYKIDFLIMGAYGHNRIRHLVIGSTTAQMLRRCNIPILLFR
ncbi:universal stress protein [Mastigocoleus sp. MO_188.B34]|uniref:universal stress protein n=1 Tax=Mastigocoleus sp. MO_188.B34 TaxID=3036635 RepID=UPI002638E5A3|nr:universal stress protein [Mastigocoleus sp. MO_188.B34]MDJ0695945.1 universal stress protein [Mastigocoleus sp. MO_188.B34]